MFMTTRDQWRNAWRSLRPLPCIVALACSAENVDPPPTMDTDAIFWTLELNHHAVTMSTVEPYDTLTLEATPRNYRGEILHGLGAPRYVSGDLAKVHVTPEGVVVALGHTGPIVVTATLTANDVTHTDSVTIVVDDLASPPKLKTFSVQPVAPDSAKSGPGLPAYLPLRAADSNDVPLAMAYGFNDGYPVFYRTSDPSIATIGGDGSIAGNRLGTIKLYAGTMLYGIAKADTVTWRIGWPIFLNVLLRLPGAGAGAGAFTPSEITVGIGASVSWAMIRSSSNPEVDVTFDADDVPSVLALDAVHHPTASTIRLFNCGTVAGFTTDCAGAGDIMLGPTVPNALRVFPAPGIYDYRSDVLGASGRVIVVDER